MRYFINKKVAVVNQLSKVTLVHNPHFLEFSSVSKSEGVQKQIKISILTTELTDPDTESRIVLTESKSNIEHVFIGTYNTDKVNNSTFLIVRKGNVLDNNQIVDSDKTARAMTAQNLCYCFMQNSYLRNNFQIISGFETDHTGNITNACSISIVAKGLGRKYSFTEEFPEVFIRKEKAVSGSVTKYDTLDYNTDAYSVMLDVYSDTGVFLGEDDALNEKNTGKYLTTLSKTYHEDSIWFDLNTLFSRKTGFSNRFLDSDGWVDAGTISDYRIIGKRNNGKQSDIIYSSGVLYVINGYDYTLNENNMDNYVVDIVEYNGLRIKSLTNSPCLNRIKGQKHYFNFILKDQIHKLFITGFTLPQSHIGLLYRFFTQSSDYIGEKVCCEQKQKQFDMVNTIELGLDELIAEIEASTNKTVGQVEVFLCKDQIEISEPLKYTLVSSKSVTLKDFAFLNRLGGWDSFNFGNESATEFKATADTFYKTLSPRYKASDSLETVFRKNVSEQMIVKTQPIKRDVAEWLRELSTSPAVYELSTKRYVIVDDFTLKYNSKDDLFQIEMKYHYSDNYNSSLNDSGK